MKVLFHSTSSNNVFHVIGSLHCLGQHEVEVFHYDGRWNEACQIAVQSNPDVLQALQMGRFDLVGIPRERVTADEDMIRRAENFRPDVQIYISAWEGMFVPSDETLARLNKIAPLVHFCFDQSDPPWWEGDANHGNVIRYEQNGCFTLQVGIDGGRVWPGGDAFPHSLDGGATVETRPLFKGLTLLTPLDPRPFAGPEGAFLERPYGVAYAGNAGGEIRGNLVGRLRHEVMGGAIRLRDDEPSSYLQFARFLKMSRLVIDVPFTGSGRAKHVKGRILEAALAGCAVMTWKDNAAVRSWFVPRYEFEEYGSIDEAIEMAKRLIKEPERCHAMADALRDRVRREHSPERFWGAVFSRLELQRHEAAAEHDVTEFLERSKAPARKSRKRRAAQIAAAAE